MAGVVGVLRVIAGLPRSLRLLASRTGMDADSHRGKGGCALFRFRERNFTFDLADLLGRHASDGFDSFPVRCGRRR